MDVFKGILNGPLLIISNGCIELKIIKMWTVVLEQSPPK
jgi:hypothetical protein